MHFLISIDDTDNLESRGTGFRARCLAQELEDEGLGRRLGISRHQLYVHEDIPYTSHNSSLCLGLAAELSQRERLIDRCRSFLQRESAAGSDAAFCIGIAGQVDEAVRAFGRQAKVEVLDQAGARGLAARTGLHLEGVTGDEGGVIGALAAVGLRDAGNDGRFVWARGVRELSGSLTAAELLAGTGIERISTLEGEAPGPDARICVEPWPRPVLLDGLAVLLVQKSENRDGDYDWELLPREAVRRY